MAIDAKTNARLMKIAMQVAAELERLPAEDPNAPALLGHSPIGHAVEEEGARLGLLILGASTVTGPEAMILRWATSAAAILERSAGDPAATRRRLLENAAYTLRFIDLLDREAS